MRALQATTPEEVARLVLAYEPLWAIGTGRAATPEQANATIGAIRGTVAGLAGQDAGAVRIQYGGSVTPANAGALFAQPEIDGALVGGASLKAQDFVAICQARTPGGSGARGPPAYNLSQHGYLVLRRPDHPGEHPDRGDPLTGQERQPGQRLRGHGRLDLHLPAGIDRILFQFTIALSIVFLLTSIIVLLVSQPA